MAGDPLYTELLIGMGYDTLSMSSHFVPQVKKRIQALSVSDATKTATECLSLVRVSRIRRFLENRLKGK